MGLWFLFFSTLADFLKEAILNDNAFWVGGEKLKTQNFFQFIQNKNTHRIMKI
jgi:hypothetical protein